MTGASRSFASARPLPEEEANYHQNHHHHQNKNGEHTVGVGAPLHGSQTSSTAVAAKGSLAPNQKETPVAAMTAPDKKKYVVSSSSNHDTTTPTQLQQQQDEPYVSPSELHYTGNATMPLTSVLHIVKPHEDVPRGIWPVFRLMVRFMYCRVIIYYSARFGIGDVLCAFLLFHDLQ